MSLFSNALRKRIRRAFRGKSHRDTRRNSILFMTPHPIPVPVGGHVRRTRRVAHGGTYAGPAGAQRIFRVR